MKPYPSYRPSGVEWLGDVPEGWIAIKIGRVSTSGMGQTILREMVSDDPSSDSLPVFSASEGDEVFGYLASPTLRLKSGDIIIGARGSIGMARLVCDPCTCTQTTIWVRLGDETVYPKFFYWAITGGREALFPFDKTAIPMLTVEQVRSAKFPLPPIPEQQAIAGFLDVEVGKIDALVAEQRRLIGLLAEKRQAVISHAVTRGLNPEAPLKPSGIDWLGDIPEGWEVVRMANLFREVSEPGNDDLPILSVSIHTGVSDDEIAAEDMDRKVTRSDDRSKYVVVRPGDLAYNMMRAWQGGFGAVKVNGMVSPAYVVARPIDADRLATDFVELLLRTPNAVTEMKRHSRGVTDFRLRLYWDEFKTIFLAVPSRVEQLKILAAIESQTSKFDTLTTTAQSAIDLLQERRAALISAAVTGKIDLRHLIPQTVKGS